MLNNILLELFNRDLPRLEQEIGTYPTPAAIWLVPTGISNSAGTLCLHLIGNLNHFIGATLGNTGYVRNRELEFSARDVPREELIAGVQQTQSMINIVLTQLSQADLDKEYPVKLFDSTLTTAHVLIHLTTHLNYHLGQINYHRRLVGMRGTAL